MLNMDSMHIPLANWKLGCFYHCYLFHVQNEHNKIITINFSSILSVLYSDYDPLVGVF